VITSFSFVDHTFFVCWSHLVYLLITSCVLVDHIFALVEHIFCQCWTPLLLLNTHVWTHLRELLNTGPPDGGREFESPFVLLLMFLLARSDWQRHCRGFLEEWVNRRCAWGCRSPVSSIQYPVSSIQYPVSSSTHPVANRINRSHVA